MFALMHPSLLLYIYQQQKIKESFKNLITSDRSSIHDHWYWSVILGGVRIDQSDFFSCSPPNSFDMVQYKTFDLKDYMVFVKKKPQPAKLLFRFPHYRAKNQSCRRPLEWPIKTSAREALDQWKKTRAQSDLPVWRKIQKPPKNSASLKSSIFGVFFIFLQTGKSDWGLVFLPFFKNVK